MNTKSDVRFSSNGRIHVEMIFFKKIDLKKLYSTCMYSDAWLNLKQIVKAVLDRQTLSAASEEAFKDNQDENIRVFLDHMFSTGQRCSMNL